MKGLKEIIKYNLENFVIIISEIEASISVAKLGNIIPYPLSPPKK